MNICSHDKKKTLFGLDREKLETLLCIVIAAVLTGASLLLPWNIPRSLVCLAAYLIVGFDVVKEAVEGITKKEAFGESFLMTVATIGAAALGEYTEAVAVMLFFRVGELLEEIAAGRSERSIRALLDVRPDYANLELPDGTAKRVAPDTVLPGQTIVIQPGERIPLDGEILSGESNLDTAALTGESLPRDVKVGDAVCSGCLNGSGVLRLRVTKTFGASTASRILELTESAAERKSKSERFIERFAKLYTPAVCGAALLLALLPPAISMLAGHPAAWGKWVYRALTFLVVSCPCALVVSVPLTFFAGLGAAGRNGVLVKGAGYLEALTKLRTVVFDKTGTLTEGVFQVAEVQPEDISREKLIELAALCECRSTHPIAVSLRSACETPPEEKRVKQIREQSGFGVTAQVDGKQAAVGSARLMEKLGIRYEPASGAGTAVYAALDGRYLGSIRISDTLKPASAKALEDLRKLGVTKTVLLSGDRTEAAEEVGKALGIDEVRAELLPDGKVKAVEELLASRPDGETLAFVGDGLNDAPVLARADIGVAMGALGSDAAVEAADVVLMDDDPRKLTAAIGTAKKCLRIVRENVYASIGVKALCLLLGALGVAGMWPAIFADVGVMLLAVLNALRAMR